VDPRNHLSEQHIMELAAIFGVIWTLSVLSFLYSDHLSIPAYVNPLALVVIMFLFMLNPTKTFRHEARFWMVRVLARVVTAPFFYVGFADFWVADQLNSLATAINDFYYLLCFYANPNSTLNGEWQVAVDHDGASCCPSWLGPLVLCLPAWFRFAQCLRRYRDTKEAFPHLANAGKYSTTFLVVLFATLDARHKAIAAANANADKDDEVFLEPEVPVDRSPFFYLWLMALVLNSCYTYTWDIKMDWGLMERGCCGSASGNGSGGNDGSGNNGNNAEENQFLREEIVYSSKGYYYFAILEDLVLRLGWAVSLSLNEFSSVDATLVSSVLAPLEIFRRFVWNFFRLENEHLNNCGKFRAVRDISVAPIDASDQAQIIKMMDEEDGSALVRKHKNTNLLVNAAATAAGYTALMGGGVSSNRGAGASAAASAAAPVAGGSGMARRLQQSELLKPLLDK